jgi:hypothetical protein
VWQEPKSGQVVQSHAEQYNARLLAAYLCENVGLIGLVKRHLYNV